MGRAIQAEREAWDTTFAGIIGLVGSIAPPPRRVNVEGALGLSRIFGRFTPHRPEEPVLGKPKAQHRLFTAVREIPSLLSS